MNTDSVIEVGRQTINSEAEALTKLSATIDGRFVQAVELMAQASGRIIMTGVGKSGHIAQKITATLASTGNPASFVHPAEAAHGDMGMITVKDVLVMLSKSGVSAEFSPIIAYALRHNIPIIAITANENSILAQNAQIVLPLPAIGEAPTTDTPAPTNSTTMMLALGDALAMALLQLQGFDRSDFALLHPAGQLGAQLMPVSEMMHSGVEMPLVDIAANMQVAVLEMTQKRLGCVGVTDGGKLTGIITDGDLRRFLNANILHLKAADVASVDPKVITSNMLCAEAVSLMEHLKISVLFVVQDQQPIGVVHLHDLLQRKVR